MEMKIKNTTSNIFLAIALLLVTSIGAMAQTPNVKERVFIDVNAHDLLVGETLQYSTYCLSHTTNQVSSLSKYLYVELIGENGVLFQRKHELVNGRANGEFFVPSNIETGQYYLVAYTRWMRNFDDTSKAPLVFINPYKGHFNENLQGVPVQVEFATASGELIANESNQVTYRISQNNKPVVRGGRIIGGETRIADIQADANGMGTVTFTPQAGTTYQLLLENLDGGFDFYDLPQPTDAGVGLNINHTESQIELEPIGNVQAGKLVIEHQGNLVFERTVQDGFTMKVNRSSLPKAALKVAFLDGSGSKKFETWLINTKLEEQPYGEALTARSAVMLDQTLETGSYSISIRKSFQSQLPQQHAAFSKIDFKAPSAKVYTKLQQAISFHKVDETDLPETIDFLPEYRYQLLQGKVIANSDSAQVADQNIVLSLTGESTLNMATAKTNDNGQFVLEYKTVNRGRTTPAHLVIPDFDNSYTFEVEDNFIQSHNLNFSTIRIDTADLDDIKQRSIISQLDNAYFTPSIDSVAIENNLTPTISNFNTHYEFDDYTRFRTMKEHFVEYIQVAGVRERRGERRFVLYELDERVDLGPNPLVLLDGVPVATDKILDFSPYRIKSLSAMNRRFYLGSLSAEGILSFQTLQGDLGGFEIDSNHLALNLHTPEVKMEQTDFVAPETTRMPDSRIQLLWKPIFEVTSGGAQQIEFSTSDVEGDYEMIIEGFTKEGTPVSIIRKFTVRGNEKG